MSIRIDYEILKKITNTEQERNIYVHNNPLARDIFWQRLDKIYSMISKYCNEQDKVLDFGGGSGVFGYGLSKYFEEVDIVDLDTSDAKNIKKYFNLKNVSIYEEDMANFSPKLQYDLVVATDVLEHFQYTQLPLDFINRILKKDGFLAITLPTENWLYELGRKIVNKQKPADHYHSSTTIINFLIRNGYKPLKRHYAPSYIVPIPLFEAIIFQKCH